MPQVGISAMYKYTAYRSVGGQVGSGQIQSVLSEDRLAVDRSAVDRYN